MPSTAPAEGAGHVAWHRVTGAQWEAIRVHLPKRKRSRKGGRPRADDRKCFEGLAWILWTGAPWSALPRRDGAKSTVHRRLAEWSADGALPDRRRGPPG